MRLHIPKCGDAARLTSDWQFALFQDWRNQQFRDAVAGLPGPSVGWQVGPAYLLPAGTELVFDRVYIRQDKDEFASVTFVVKDHPTREDLVGERFWVKLDDANRLELELTDSNNPVGGFPKGRYQAMLRERRQPELADKRRSAEASRADLQAARDYVRELCDQSSSLNRSSFETQQHIEGIIRSVLQGQYPQLHAGARRASLRASDVRFEMTCCVRRKSDPERWHARTSANLDGTTTRDLRFAWEGTKHGGFRLTMKGSEVISCVPLA